MNPKLTNRDIFDINSDPDFQSLLAEFDHASDNMRTEVSAVREANAAAARAVAAAESAAESGGATPSLPPELQQLEAQYGASHSEEAFQGAELTHQVGHTVENLAEQIFEQGHHPAATKELQWFYARGAERVGPIIQSQLLQLLQGGNLPWTTLVWNKKLSDWSKASETELIELSEEPAPPPLPPPLPSAKKQAQKEQKCKACGRANGPNDRFCSGCGKPLRKSSK